MQKLHSPPDLGSSIDSLFPACIAWHWSADRQEAGPLLGEERTQADRMSERRRAMFRLGRHCAREAIVSLGGEAGPLPIGEGRAPAWPPGYVGSITHTDDLALAAAASRSDLAALGIDIETRGEVEAGVRRLICRDDERAVLDQLGGPDVADRLLFSAKESVYKCIWPTVRRFVDFLEVALAFEPRGQRFRISMAEGLPAPLCSRLTGSYRITGTHIATLAYVDSSVRQD